jgi:hypothetical protein
MENGGGPVLRSGCVSRPWRGPPPAMARLVRCGARIAVGPIRPDGGYRRFPATWRCGAKYLAAPQQYGLRHFTETPQNETRCCFM